MHYRDFRAMNTNILLAAEGSPEQVEAGFAQAEAFIHSSEQRFTRFSPDSELSRLNRSAGSWFQASPDMFEVINLALELHIQTDGLFDPGILDALERAGYDRSMDEIRANGTQPRVEKALLLRQAFGDIRLEAANHSIWIPVGLRIDLGGIAKGWIAERTANLLSQYASPCAVDAGGDAFMIGTPLRAKDWRVTLEDPCDPSQAAAFLKIRPGAVATSAVTKRRWQQDGKEQHHLIDPRTLRPAETQWLSVTVTAPHAAEAEVFAKCLLIGGHREAERLANSAPGIEYIVIDRNKRLWGSKHSRELLDV